MLLVQAGDSLTDVNSSVVKIMQLVFQCINQSWRSKEETKTIDASCLSWLSCMTITTCSLYDHHHLQLASCSCLN